MANDEKDFVVFDHELPESLLGELNNLYDNMHEKKHLVNEHTALKKRESSAKGGFNRSFVSIFVFSQVFIMAPLIICALLFIFPHVRQSLGRRDTNEEQAPLLPRNLALTSEGGYILEKFTTSPAFSPWWKWSSAYEVSADCLIRPGTAECWPLAADSAIGFGLEMPSLIYSVKVNLTTSPGSSHAAPMSHISSPHPVAEVVVYGVDAENQIRRIGRSGNSSKEVETQNTTAYTSVIIRIRTPQQSEAALSCLNSVEVNGLHSKSVPDDASVNEDVILRMG